MILISFNTTGLSRWKPRSRVSLVFFTRNTLWLLNSCSLFAFIEQIDEKTRLKFVVRLDADGRLSLQSYIRTSGFGIAVILYHQRIKVAIFESLDAKVM